MRSVSPSRRDDRGADPLDQAIDRLTRSWKRDQPIDVALLWTECDSERSLAFLTALIKIDLRFRLARGDSVSTATYLERFPQLAEFSDRVVSLIYEEFCLREEEGEEPDPDSFCDRYDRWKDSLASQLRYHKMLSRGCAAREPAPRFPEPGEWFQSFRLRSILGQGGAARVFLANDEELGDREVALKVSADRGKEPSILGRLDHEHIVPVLSVTREQERGLRGLCMPYRPGAPVDAVIRRLYERDRPTRAIAIIRAIAPSGATDEEIATVVETSGWRGYPIDGTYMEGVAWIVMTLARALEHAHSLRILHRDVKPANILLTYRDGPQLLDFNLAHDPFAADRADAALRGGTLPYMAPEQLHAFLDPDRWEQVDESADLYSLGLLFRELLTGELPETPDPRLPTPRAIAELLDRRSAPPISLRKINPSIPHALQSIVNHCLDLSPADRYPNATSLAEDLERFLDRRRLVHASNNSWVESAVNWTRRRKPARVGAFIVLFVVVSAFLLVFRSPPTDSRRPLGDPADRNVPNRFHAAIDSIRGGRFEQARKSIAKSLEDDPESPFGLTLAGLIEDRLGRIEEARSALTRASGRDSELEAFRAAARLASQSPLVQEEAGWAAARHDAWTDVKNAFLKAAELDPTHRQKLKLLAQVDTSSGRSAWPGVLAALAWSRTRRSDSIVENQLKNIFNYKDADACLLRALEIVPEEVALPIAYGAQLASLNRFQESETMLDRALKIDPKHPAALNLLSHIAESRDRDLPKALRLLTEALSSAEARKEAVVFRFGMLLNRARVRIILGENRQASIVGRDDKIPASSTDRTSLEESRLYFAQARDDLKIAFRLHDENQNEIQKAYQLWKWYGGVVNIIRFRTAKAEIGLGDADSFENRLEAAIAHYNEAGKSIESVPFESIPQEKFRKEVEDLKEAVKIRVARDGALLEIERSGRAGSTKGSASTNERLESARKLLQSFAELNPPASELQKLRDRIDRQFQVFSSLIPSSTN